jgi:hypothetical protein
MSEDIEDVKSISLGEEERLELWDENEVFISLIKQGKTVSKITMPWPSKGYGGGSLLVSPSKKYLVFHYYSGQSEEAFKLYSIGNELVEIFDSGYQFGEAASFCFDHSENTLVMAYPFSCCEWWQPWEDGELCVDESDRKYIEFGKCHFLNIQKRSFTAHQLRVAINQETEIVMEDYDPLLCPLLNGQLQLLMPWGKVNLDIPLKESIMLSLPSGVKIA